MFVDQVRVVNKLQLLSFSCIVSGTGPDGVSTPLTGRGEEGRGDPNTGEADPTLARHCCA